MTQFFAGPVLNNTFTIFPATFPNNVLQVAENIIGVQVENYSIFDILVTGENTMNFHLWPFQGVYLKGVTNFLNFTTFGTSRPKTNFDVNKTAIMVYFDWDSEVEPPASIPYSIFSPSPIIAAFGNVQSVTATANSSSAHTTTLGPFNVSPLLGGGLYLTHISYMFGNPAAAASGDCTLTDGTGVTLMTWHLNLTVAGPQVHIEEDLTLPGLPAGFENGNISRFNFNNPAITNGPGYSVNMIAYNVQ